MVERSRLTELHYITPIANLVSIAESGVLAHAEAAKVAHASVAMEDVQEKRDLVKIPGGLKLHQYANCYFNARNTMMFKRAAFHAELAVLSIRTAALDLPDVVLTDRNAACRTPPPDFGSVEEILPKLDYDLIFAQYWNHDDYYEKRRHRAMMCAEVLVPTLLPASYVRGAWVSSHATARVCEGMATGLKFKADPYVFFQGPKT